jgi:hypothetical protein
VSKRPDSPKVNDAVRTTEPVPSDFTDGLVYPAGTLGGIVEVWHDPERYCVDLAVPDDTLVGGSRYDNVVLRPAQFTVVRRGAAVPSTAGAG